MIRYCIEHGYFSHTKEGTHLVYFTDSNGESDLYYCFGPFASCRPPQLEEGWQYNLQDPSPEELVQMDLSAAELLLDIEG